MKARMFMLLLVTAWFTWSLSGCVTNPETGAVSMTPESVEVVDSVADTTEAVVPVAAAGASAIFPVLTPIFTGIAGLILAGIGVWRTLKPQLVAETEAKQKYYDVAAAIVAGIENFKEASPETWAKLEVKLAQAIGPKAENVIRALRGLPAKD